MGLKRRGKDINTCLDAQVEMLGQPRKEHLPDKLSMLTANPRHIWHPCGLWHCAIVMVSHQSQGQPGRAWEGFEHADRLREQRTANSVHTTFSALGSGGRIVMVGTTSRRDALECVSSSSALRQRCTRLWLQMTTALSSGGAEGVQSAKMCTGFTPYTSYYM